MCDPLAPKEGATKQCRRCGETQPLSSFPRNRHGNPHPCCHKCTHIERGERRAARPAWRNEHFDRRERELEARQRRQEYRLKQAEAKAVAAANGEKQCSRCKLTLPLGSFSLEGTGKPTARCKSCAATVARERYHRKHGRSGSGTAMGPRGTISPEKRREAAERIAHLTSLLMFANSNERITSQEAWNVTTSELEKLWHLSGDKECASCGAVVPSTAMRPPGPANFYTGKCNSCATEASEAAHRATYGPLIGPLPGPPKIPMLDGSRITVAEFGRRVRERQAIAYANNPRTSQ